MRADRRFSFLGHLSRRYRCCTFCSLALALLLPAIACGQQVGLKQRLYTNGSSVRRTFSEATEAARQSTVQVLNGERVCAQGVIVDAEGWILTKASELGKDVHCRLANGTTHPAEVVARHEGADLALLKIAAQDLTPIEWETDPRPAVGQWVICTGVREIPEAIGVVGAERRKIPFVRIPGILGVALENDDSPPQVTRVTTASAADAAGIKVGDVIEQIDARKLANRGEMIDVIQKHDPGDTIELAIRRGSERLSIKATLTDPPSNEFLTRIAIQNRMGGDLSRRRTGFEAVIQHDAVLRPEECGGPAVGLNGRALGINIARAGRTETYTLPADLVIPLIEELKLQAPASLVSKE